MPSLIQPVVLCGGSGTRLWPLSRKAFPKQFIPLIGEKSLLQLTLERLKPLIAEGTLTCIGAEEHRFLVADAGTRCDLELQQILEPEGRNTAPAIALAALAAPGYALLLICPADHHVPDADAFLRTVMAARPAAEAAQIVTFGIAPTFPSSAYGYIQRGNGNERRGYAVERFVEKPSAEVAMGLLASGDYLWNAGIFLARADVLLEALRVHAPQILSACRQAMAGSVRDGAFIRPDAGSFSTCPSESIDYAVMEKAGNVMVFPFLGAWSDVGSWNAVADLSQADDVGNRSGGKHAHAHHLLSRDTYIHAGGDRPVVTLGTEGLLVVDTPDALLVAGKSHAEAVRQVVAKLEALDANEAVYHRRVARPWGWYDRIDLGPRHQVKRITVKQNASLSLQMHRRRAEHWVVVSGTAEVTNGDQTLTLQENESTYIPIGQKHRLVNVGDGVLEIIEVQTGEYLGEDDIVRFSDVYGRN